MTTITTAEPTSPTARARLPWARLISLGAALGAVPVFALAGLTGDSGAEITAGLEAEIAVLTIASIVALLVSAALVVAAVRLGRSVPGDTGAVLLVAGSLVAMMYAGYYAVFGAGAVVASQVLTDPGPGLGEAASLMLNVMEIARFAPGLALVAAALAARRHLPRGVRIAAGVLVVLTLLPFTTWVAALLIPVWLGVSAALVPGASAGSREG